MPMHSLYNIQFLRGRAARFVDGQWAKWVLRSAPVCAVYACMCNIHIAHQRPHSPIFYFSSLLFSFSAQFYFMLHRPADKCTGKNRTYTFGLCRFFFFLLFLLSFFFHLHRHFRLLLVAFNAVDSY